MALEVLIITLCLGDYRCDMASKAYYEQSPKLKQYAKHAGQVAAKEIGPILTFIAPATISLFARHTARIRLNKHLTLEVKPDTMNILWAMTF